MKQQPWILPLLLAMVISSWALVGCSQSETASTNTTAEANTITAQASSPQMSELPRLEGKATVMMTINGSEITMEVDGENAPITAGNFVDLVNRGVYDGLMFHRVVKDPQPFVVQGGDPQSKDPDFPQSRLGTGSFINPETGSPRYIPLEIKPQGAEEPIYGKTLEQAGISGPPELRHSKGALSMARSQMPNSASSQFYFALADLSFLDGNYAVFGYVNPGDLGVIDQIKQGDRIESAQVVSGLENLQQP
ncbi:peptidylprolyl isomerase [Spirulina sp. CS-785/01]|uniref:peptidylprolyl isomerase n=1 Tax=Spirulina sp. CS-785/01 TaxID=3021716 RepID=UPI00232C4B1E|nr:peptidylprolyl isomerase [Spirulina sp. CS-785/01]MDB9313699.1 peptidylprolyl isomerase [Spirulina sp. CS-785/01]